MPSVYKIIDGQTIFDAAIETYGSLEQVYKLIQENPEIDSIDFDLLENPGISVGYDETFNAPETQEERKVPQVPKSTTYFVKDGQTIFDLALGLYGNLEKVYKIIKDNENIIPYINKSLSAGKNIVVTPEEADDTTLTSYFIKNNITLNTSIPEVNTGSGFTIGFVTESYY